MTRDFSLAIFKELLEEISKKYIAAPFADYITQKKGNVLILRHDIDAKKENALLTAKIEYELGLKGTYYFRVVPQSFDKKLITQIAELGHEIGYHYEDVDFANGDITKAIDLFKVHLEMLRRLYPVKTICMHGSPLSKYDNRDLWKKFDYRDYGLIGEPYFDLDFGEFLYLTDTGRRWNGTDVSVRDKVKSAFNFNFNTTFDIIRSVEKLPFKAMFTFHPQRWEDNYLQWTKELIFQNIKNTVKKYYYVKR
ncbi:MAG: hypothetical protein HF312_13135 [Ignavibacteria bacterium]|jgi:hypothetical protein|nr:hypothetical protein [Ignavibacteria bacterium]